MKAPAESFKISRQFFCCCFLLLFFCCCCCFFFLHFFFFFFFFFFLLKIMCVYFLQFQNIFKDSQKEKKKKKHFKKITVSRQFSISEIGNFGTDQLRDTGRIQWWVPCVLTIGVQANVACCRCLRQRWPYPYKLHKQIYVSSVLCHTLFVIYIMKLPWSYNLGWIQKLQWHINQTEIWAEIW